jgi:hypothetical protein
MTKRFLFVLIMVAAVGLPYLATSSTDWLSYFSSQHAGSADATAATAGGKLGANSGGAQHDSAAGPLGKPPAIEGLGAADLGEVLRFDGTPGWVMARWPRVTAGLAELDLQGYRVPLVTGTTDDDLAGSLTYYFDKNQHVAFINFKGTTGNPRKLIALVTARYRFLQQKTDDPGLSLYQVNWNGKPQSELRIRTAPIVRADQPHARFEVELAMKRP